MGIPERIGKEDIINAIDIIDRKGIPPKRKSTKFDLINDNRMYPPKYVVSIAAKIATGNELPPNHFYGGPETNSFLTKLGFKIRERNIVPL